MTTLLKLNAMTATFLCVMALATRGTVTENISDTLLASINAGDGETYASPYTLYDCAEANMSPEEKERGVIPAWKCQFEFETSKQCIVCKDASNIYFAYPTTEKKPSYKGVMYKGMYVCSGDKYAGVCKDQKCVSDFDPSSKEGFCDYQVDEIEKWVKQPEPGDPNDP